MDKTEIQAVINALDGQLTEWDLSFLSGCIAKLGAGESLGERDLRALDQFKSAVVRHAE